MKVKLIKNGIGTKKEFENKKELFEFVQNYCVNIIYNEDNLEERKIKILKTDNFNKFTIYDLVEMIDYKLNYKAY